MAIRVISGNSVLQEAFEFSARKNAERRRKLLRESQGDDSEVRKTDDIIKGTATASSFEKFEKAVKLLNRRLEEEGKPKVLCKASKRRYEKLGKLLPKLVTKDSPYYSYYVEVVDYEISSGIGSYLEDSGYEVVAVVDHKENIIHNISNYPGVEKFRNRTDCDFCHKPRYRITTFILRDLKTDELTQIGSNCVKAFTGIDPKTLLKEVDVVYHELKNLEELEAIPEGEGWGGLIPSNDIQPSTRTAIRNIILIINRWGFVPQSKEDVIAGVIPTKSKAIDSFIPPPKGMPEKGFFNKYEITDEEIEQAEKYVDDVLDWMKNLYVGDDDFKGNLKQMAQNKFVTNKSIGYLCAGVNLYFRSKKFEEDTKEEGQEFYGNVGERVELKSLDVLSIRGYDNAYGGGFVITMKDPQQRLFVWFCSTNNHPGIGDKVDLVGTIKDHKEFRGKKQTYLSRCKIVKTIEKPKEEAYFPWRSPEAYRLHLNDEILDKIAKNVDELYITKCKGDQDKINNLAFIKKAAFIKYKSRVKQKILHMKEDDLTLNKVETIIDYYKEGIGEFIEDEIEHGYKQATN